MDKSKIVHFVLPRTHDLAEELINPQHMIQGPTNYTEPYYNIVNIDGQYYQAYPCGCPMKPDSPRHINKHVYGCLSGPTLRYNGFLSCPGPSVGKETFSYNHFEGGIQYYPCGCNNTELEDQLIHDVESCFKYKINDPTGSLYFSSRYKHLKDSIASPLKLSQLNISPLLKRRYHNSQTKSIELSEQTKELELSEPSISSTSSEKSTVTTSILSIASSSESSIAFSSSTASSDESAEEADLSSKGNNCDICFDAKADILILPCTHIVICSACLADYQTQNMKQNKIAICPICLIPIEQIVVLAKFHFN